MALHPEACDWQIRELVAQCADLDCGAQEECRPNAPGMPAGKQDDSAHSMYTIGPFAEPARQAVLATM